MFNAIYLFCVLFTKGKNNVCLRLVSSIFSSNNIVEWIYFVGHCYHMLPALVPAQNITRDTRIRYIEHTTIISSAQHCFTRILKTLLMKYSFNFKCNFISNWIIYIDNKGNFSMTWSVRTWIWNCSSSFMYEITLQALCLIKKC